MSAKHTPGQWYAAPLRDSGWIDIFSVYENGETSLPFASCKHHDQEANARLIAAAPELLEALQRVCSHGERTSAQIDADWDHARAAIAKATGGAV